VTARLLQLFVHYVEYIIGNGVISLTEIPFQNCTVYGTGASVLNGILNSAGSGTLDFTSNSVISCSNELVFL
jgi:hypothetical protein